MYHCEFLSPHPGPCCINLAHAVSSQPVLCNSRREQFLQWTENLTDQQTPSWLGLPNNAEKVLLTTRGGEMISKLLKMQLLEDDDELAYTPTPGSENQDAQREARDADGRPAWMRTLHNSLSTWLQMVPKVGICFTKQKHVVIIVCSDQ